MIKPETFQGDLANLPAALEPLTASRCWVNWMWEWKPPTKTTPGKWDKPPKTQGGRNVDATNPQNWITYSKSVAAWQASKVDGIGVALKHVEGVEPKFAAFDVDNCRDRTTGALKASAIDLLKRCGSYAEITPSGTGIRILGFSNGGTPRHTKDPIGDGVSIEIYRDAKRYITITGKAVEGYDGPLVNIDAVVDEVYAEIHKAGGRPKSQPKPESKSEQAKKKPSGGAVPGGDLPKRLINLLMIPDQGKGEMHGKYKTRSGVLFAFLTGCCRAGIGKDVAFNGCIDERYRGKAVYEHCAEQMQGADKRDFSYLDRQIERAWTAVEEGNAAKEDEVEKINRTHALVLAGNKAAVMRGEGGTKFRLLQLDAFKQWFANRFVPVGDKMIPLGKYWLNHPERRQFAGIEFEPGGGRAGYYNLWRGFRVKPCEGDCSKFLAHIKDNAACGDNDTYLWIVGWFAQMVQQPTIKMETALALRGPQGTGKTKIGQVIGSLFGEHYALVSNPRYITGQFNAHLASLILLHADEAFWAGDKKSEGTLKDLVTGTEHMIEFKGVDPIRVKNFIRLFVCGNSDWLVPAGFGERRFAIFDMGEDKMQDNDYFAAIDREMDNGGREALLFHLLNFDLKQVNLRKIPKTAALEDQQIETMTSEQSWWLDMLTNGELPSGHGEPRICTKDMLHQSYIQHARMHGANYRSIGVRLGRFLLKHVGPALSTKRRVTSGASKARPWCYELPSLKDCRVFFAQKLGQKIDWGEGWEEDDWEQVHYQFRCG